MPPFHLPQNKCYGVIKYEKLNYSHRILNIPKIYIFFFFKFFFLIFFWCGRKKWCARRREPRVLICLALYALFPCSDFVSQMWGGGGCNVFYHFMLFPTFLENKIWEYKTIISHLMFSCFFLYAGNIEKCPFTYSYWLNGRWFPK